MKSVLLCVFCSITTLALVTSPEESLARDTRQHMLPNALYIPGYMVIDDEPYACILCHVDSEGDSERNPFGMDVEDIIEGAESTRPPFWGAFLASLDSDGDGYTNGEELQDPTGTLLQQLFDEPVNENFPRLFPVPDLDELLVGNPELVSLPGDPESTPPGGGGGSGTSTPTSTQPAAETPTPTPTLTHSTTATTTPTATLADAATATQTATTAPTESHTPTRTVTATSEGNTPTPTPSHTETEIGAPSATPTNKSFDRDGNLFVNGQDLLILLHEKMSIQEWFEMSASWHQEE